MRRTRTFIRGFCGLLLLVLLVTGSLTNGLRHHHEGGRIAHSHHHDDRAESGEVQPHSHGNPASGNTPKDAHLTASAELHVHVTLFGFELTMPDFGFSGPAPQRDAVPGNSKHPSIAKLSVATDECISLHSPFTDSQWLQVVMNWIGIVPERVDAHANTLAGGRNHPSQWITARRDRESPPLPPPKRA